MPSLEMAWDPDPLLSTASGRKLPHPLETKSCWTTPATEGGIRKYRGDEDNTVCRLCQQHFTTHRRLRVHLPQHFVTTFCPCGEYSYHRDYILRHQRTMNCFPGSPYDVDEDSYPTFLDVIRLFVTDPDRLERLT